MSGLTLSADLTDELVSVSYDSNSDMADMFTLVLRNPDNRLTDSPLFDLGKTVELHMGYGDELEPMMLGEVASLQPSFPEGGSPTLTVSGYDRSQALRHNQPDRAPFKYMADSAIAALIAGEAGLIPVVDPSPLFHEQIQQTDSDMTFLRERARENFFEVYVHWDRLYFQFPRPQTEAYVLEWGKSLSSFTPRLANSGMTGIQVVRGYNEELAQAVVGLATSAELGLDDVVEKLGSEALQALVSLGRRAIRNKPVKSPLDAATIAKATLQELMDGMYEGSGSTVGIPELRANRWVAVNKVGKRFSGRYRLKRVTHILDDRGYRTNFEVTQRAGANLLSLLRKSISDAPAPDKQQTFQGVVVGKVIDNVDPQGYGRIKVSFPWFSDSSESAWARCVTPMASGGRGLYMLPDVDDEVAVMFEHGAFDRPVVVGSMWNGVARPPLEHKDRLNRIRLIKTRGHTITLDDTKEAERIEVKDKAGQTIVLDSKKGAAKIELKDAAGSVVTMDGVTGVVTVDAAAQKDGVVVEGGTNGAARGGDPVTVYIPALSVITAASQGVQNMAAIKCTGTIDTSGVSTKVKIG